MYYLCRLRTNVHDDTVFGHPFGAVMQSEDLAEIEREIIGRVRDGCATNKLKVFEGVEFDFAFGVEWGKRE